jgi:hypothetical protein
MGHRTKWAAHVVHIETGYYDTYALISELIAYFGQTVIEELGFINANYFNVAREQQKLRGVIHHRASNGCLVVAYDVFFVVTIVNTRFENLNLHFGELRAAHTAYEFFRFSGKHRAANDFNPSLAATAIIGVF